MRIYQQKNGRDGMKRRGKEPLSCADASLSISAAQVSLRDLPVLLRIFKYCCTTIFEFQGAVVQFILIMSLAGR